MIRKNPFKGKGKYVKFIKLIYSRFLSREWFSHTDVMVDFLKLKSADELTYSISKCPENGELKKASIDIVKLIEEKAGPGSIETRGNNRTKEFRYVGADNNPLEVLQNDKAIDDIKKYAQFCEDSAGFFPRSWLEYFFDDTLDLLNITHRQKSGEQMISSSIDRELKNVELLPMIYEHIRDKKILTIIYKPYEEEMVTLRFHPHLLKEHNGRWFLFGHAEGKEPEFGYNLALDRIETIPEETSAEEKFIKAPKGFYSEFFKHIVGVSHFSGMEATEITIRATNKSIFNLTETKKIHHSQVTLKPFATHDDGDYGEFRLLIEPNNEFIGRILQMGEGLEIIAPDNIRNIFRQKIIAMYNLYNKS